MAAAQPVDLHNVLTLEDVRLQDVNSIETYITELEYFKRLLTHHVERCKHWQETEATRPGLGKLHEFLKTLEG